VFPRRKGITEAQISDALGVLANTGMVTLYEYDGEPYFYFPKWGEHQRIQTKKSRFPDPEESTVIHRDPPSETKEKEKPKPNPNEKGERAPARFTPPTLEEVADYVLEKGYTWDPEAFFDFYVSKGWKVGAQPMKDWKAAVRNWDRLEDKYTSGKGKRSSGSYHARRDDSAAMARVEKFLSSDDNQKTMEQVKRLREKINGGGE